MDLLCIESQVEARAYLDPVFVDDDRVLKNLLTSETKYTLTSNYFKCFQTQIKTNMRNIVCVWMLEVCEEEKCQDEVFPLAMNLFDRFLSVVTIVKNQLQLLGATCLFLSSKMRQTCPISAEKLVAYTDYSIKLEELGAWELLVLNRLKWDVSAITANDFVNPLLRRLPSAWTKGTDMYNRIKNHTQTFISLCAADFQFALYPPSMVAAACISTAILGFQRSSSQWKVSQSLHLTLNQITGIEVDCLHECQEQIECMITSHVKPDQPKGPSPSSTSSFPPSSPNLKGTPSVGPKVTTTNINTNSTSSTGSSPSPSSTSSSTPSSSSSNSITSSSSVTPSGDEGDQPVTPTDVQDVNLDSSRNIYSESSLSFVFTP